MVVGFNHNFAYKGIVYHIQTEDGGLNSPTIVTLLYRGGTILASRKTSYADITRVDNLAQVVEELMKEQHKRMLRGLKNGEFDAAIARFDASASQEQTFAAPARPLPARAPAGEPSPRPAAPAPTTVAPAPKSAVSPVPAAPTAARAGAVPKRAAAGEASLDEVILSYLLGEEK